MTPSLNFTVRFEPPDEDGWIVAQIEEVPGAMSQGRTREEARENALDALQVVLTPDDELRSSELASTVEHVRFVAA